MELSHHNLSEVPQIHTFISDHVDFLHAFKMLNIYIFLEYDFKVSTQLYFIVHTMNLRGKLKKEITSTL